MFEVDGGKVGAAGDVRADEQRIETRGQPRPAVFRRDGETVQRGGRDPGNLGGEGQVDTGGEVERTCRADGIGAILFNCAANLEVESSRLGGVRPDAGTEAARGNVPELQALAGEPDSTFVRLYREPDLRCPAAGEQ